MTRAKALCLYYQMNGIAAEMPRDYEGLPYKQLEIADMWANRWRLTPEEILTGMAISQPAEEMDKH